VTHGSTKITKTNWIIVDQDIEHLVTQVIYFINFLGFIVFFLCSQTTVAGGNQQKLTKSSMNSFFKGVISLSEKFN
jgi:hypothetical protein